MVAITTTFLFFGCSSTRLIKHNENFELQKSATLVNLSNDNVQIKSMKTVGDSVFAIGYYSNRQLHLSRSDVEKVVVNSRKKGFLKGCLIGGVGAGTITYLAIPNDDGMKGFGVAVWTQFGGIAGGVIGAIRGDKKTYLFENPTEETTPSQRN